MHSLIYARRLLPIVVAILALAPAALAGDSLARLVPDNAGLCVEVQHLAEQVDRFAAGPLFARWQAFPPLKLWNDKNLPALQIIFSEINRQLGVDTSEVWRHALGRQSVLAVWPPNPADPVPTPGLLLVEAADERLLPRLFDALRRAQERAGELAEYREESHAGTTYRVHVMKRGDTQTQIYLAAAGRVGVLASHQHLIQRVLELRLQSPERPQGLASLGAYQAAQAQLPPDSALRAFVNPRAWDAALQAIPRASNPEEARNQGLLLAAWSAMQYVASALRVTPQPTWEFAVKFEGLPESSPVAELLDSFSGATDLSQRVPADCLLAAAWRIDLGRLIRLAASLETRATGSAERTNPVLTIWNLLDQLLAGVGPGMGFVFLPAEDPMRQLPIDVLAAIQIRSRAKAMRPPTDENLQEILRTVLLLAATLNNLQPDALAAEVKAVKAQGRTFTQVTNVKSLPPGMTATFAVTEAYLLLATSLEAAASVTGVEKDRSLAATSPVLRRVSSRLDQPGHLLYLNLGATRRFVDRHAAALVANVAEWKGITAAQAQLGLRQLQLVLQLADEAVLAAKIDRHGIAISAALDVNESRCTMPD